MESVKRVQSHPISSDWCQHDRLKWRCESCKLNSNKNSKIISDLRNRLESVTRERFGERAGMELDETSHLAQLNELDGLIENLKNMKKMKNSRVDELSQILEKLRVNESEISSNLENYLNINMYII